MQCKILGGEIHLHHTQELMLVEAVWWSGVGEEHLTKVCLSERDGDMGPSSRKGNLYKLILQI